MVVGESARHVALFGRVQDPYLSWDERHLRQDEAQERAATEVARIAGLELRVVREEMEDWQLADLRYASGRERATAIGLHLATQAEFGLADARTDHWAAEDLAAAHERLMERPWLRRLVRGAWEYTQRWLREQEVAEVALFRGVSCGLPVGRTEVHLQPLSSFSPSISAASSFGSRVMGAVVPAERIIACAWTGMGDFGNAEVVILGGAAEVTVSPAVSDSCLARKFFAGRREAA